LGEVGVQSGTAILFTTEQLSVIKIEWNEITATPIGGMIVG
jgi:hypothetical protein